MEILTTSQPLLLHHPIPTTIILCLNQHKRHLIGLSASILSPKNSILSSQRISLKHNTDYVNSSLKTLTFIINLTIKVKFKAITEKVSCGLKFLTFQQGQLLISKFQSSQVVLVVKNLPANAGDIIDMGSIPGSGRSPGGEHGNPFQYSCLENPMDRGAWWATVHRVAKRLN